MILITITLRQVESGFQDDQGHNEVTWQQNADGKDYYIKKLMQAKKKLKL